MNSLTWFMFAVIAIALAQSERLDAGPQTFADKTPAEQKPQKRETKEIVVYLTPSQIKAIQEGSGFLNAEPVNEAERSQENLEETEQEETEQEETEQEETEQEETEQEETEPEENDFQLGSLQLDSQLEEEDNQLPSSIPVEEPTSEELEEEPQFSWIYRPPQDKTFVPSPEDNYAYLRYFPETAIQTEEAQPESEENEEENEEVEPEVQQQRFRLVPYESETEKSEPSTTRAPQEDPIRERWLRLLEQNRAQLKKTQEKAAATTTTEQPQAEPETTLARLRFSARYNGQKQAIENEEQLRKDIKEKQKALIRAEADANNAPVVVRKEVKTTKQAPLIKHVKVHTPIIVPIPEPFEVKVPHPFPVPLEIFRPIAAKASKTRKAAKKSSAAARAEEKSKAPKKSSTTTEKPAAERRAPAEPKKEAPVEVSQRQRGKPERITIIRHVFEN